MRDAPVRLLLILYNWRRDEDATPHATDDVSSVIYSVRQRQRRVSDGEFGHLMTVIKPD